MVTRSTATPVTTTALRILMKNPNRSSYFIINQDPATAIWVASGTSSGPHVTTAGNHMGTRLGPNGGSVFDNDDLDEVWAISTAVNPAVIITEKTGTGRLQRT